MVSDATKEYRKQWRKLHPEKQKDYDKKNYDKRRQFLDFFKQERGCKICGENDPRCLDFHHKDPSKKIFDVGHNLKRAWTTVKTEIAKCEILCSNCHRKLGRTFKN